jgi:hypothetical protein
MLTESFQIIIFTYEFMISKIVEQLLLRVKTNFAGQRAMLLGRRANEKFGLAGAQRKSVH